MIIFLVKIILPFESFTMIIYSPDANFEISTSVLEIPGINSWFIFEMIVPFKPIIVNVSCSVRLELTIIFNIFWVGFGKEVTSKSEELYFCMFTSLIAEYWNELSKSICFKR